jgi:hypothetical protein
VILYFVSSTQLKAVVAISKEKINTSREAASAAETGTSTTKLFVGKIGEEVTIGTHTLALVCCVCFPSSDLSVCLGLCHLACGL